MIFKKHISILVTFFLLVSNLGLAFNVHYCDDKIASVSINTIPDAKEAGDECCGIAEKESSCCKDKIIKSEVRSDQVIVNLVLLDFIAFADYQTPQLFTVNNNFQQRSKATYYCNANAPPLYLLYSQYTFYA